MIILIKHKTCSKCSTEYPATTEFFHIDRRTKSGFNSQCKSCKKELYMKHKETNKDRLFDLTIKKQCSVCKLWFPATPSFFNKKCDSIDGLRSQCKKCRGRIILERNLFLRYGITMDIKKKMYNNQNNKCLICGYKFKNLSRAHIDHCHKTNKVRGLLCFSCNAGLGNFKDSPLILSNAIQYLTQNFITDMESEINNEQMPKL